MKYYVEGSNLIFC